MTNRRAKRPHPAQIYNEKRRILFSTYHKDPDLARNYLEGYKPDLGATGYSGLKAELDFYEQMGIEFGLAVALDAGDSTDFTGQVGDTMFRFDVTTNESFKSLSTYEPFQVKGCKYKIAIVDKVNGELIDLVDINFPFCGSCGGDQRLFDVAVMLPENRMGDGGSTMEFDQVHIRFCSVCDRYDQGSRITTSGLMDVETAHAAYLETQGSLIEPRSWGDGYSINALRYLRKAFNENLVALAGNRYTITDPSSGEGYWETCLTYVRPLVHDILPTEFGTTLTE